MIVDFSMKGVVICSVLYVSSVSLGMDFIEDIPGAIPDAILDYTESIMKTVVSNNVFEAVLPGSMSIEGITIAACTDSMTSAYFEQKKLLHKQKSRLRLKGANATPEKKMWANQQYKDIYPFLHDDDSSEVFPDY